MILGVSGHRPDKVGGYRDNPLRQQCIKAGRDIIELLKPERIITGMALGWDQWMAQLALDLGIKYTAAVPFEGQEKLWPVESQRYYVELLSQADEMHIVSPGGYAAWKMEVRNRWVVDHSDRMLFLLDGSPGGTNNCHNYT